MIKKLKSNTKQQLIPVLWASLFDITITAAYQSKEYWSGNLQMADEANPIGNYFMNTHVLGLFLISGIWIILICVLAFVLPSKLSKIFLLFVLIAHSWGASTWLNNYFGFWAVMVFIFVNSVLYIYCNEPNK